MNTYLYFIGVILLDDKIRKYEQIHVKKTNNFSVLLQGVCCVLNDSGSEHEEGNPTRLDSVKPCSPPVSAGDSEHS